MAAPINNQLPLPAHTGTARQERNTGPEGAPALRVGEQEAASTQPGSGDTLQLSETARRLSAGEISERPLSPEDAYAMVAKLKGLMAGNLAQALAAQAGRVPAQASALLG